MYQTLKVNLILKLTTFPLSVFPNYLTCTYDKSKVASCVLRKILLMYVRYLLIKYTPKFLGVLREYENMKEERETMSLSPNHWTHSYMIFSCRLSVEPFVPWTFFYIANLSFVIYESYPCLALQFLKIFLMSKTSSKRVQQFEGSKTKKRARKHIYIYIYIYIISKTNWTRQTVVHEICTLKGIKHCRQ